MISVHDFLPTLASFIGAKVPQDRPYDGYDQSDFLLGKQENSNREHLLTFIGDRLVAVRWRQFRIYPVEFHYSDTNPRLGGYLGTAAYGGSMGLSHSGLLWKSGSSPFAACSV